MMKLRPEVVAFACLMERELRANDHRPGWKGDMPVLLAKRVVEEAADLERATFAFQTGAPGHFAADAVARIAKEAADVANMAMMVADVAGALPDTDADDDPPHFDISDDGVMTALPAWPRNDHTTMLRLLMASIEVDESTIATWSDDQCKAAEVWACSVHLSASDNDDIVVPPKPDFLPAYVPFRGIIPDHLA